MSDGQESKSRLWASIEGVLRGKLSPAPTSYCYYFQDRAATWAVSSQRQKAGDIEYDFHSSLRVEGLVSW